MFFLWLLYLLKDFSVYGKKYFEILAGNFLPVFRLHWCSGMSLIFTFTAEYFVTILFMKIDRSVETKKLIVTTMVPKLQSLILLLSRNDVQLEHCFVPSVSISPQSSRKNKHFSATKHNNSKPAVAFECKLCYQEFQGFHAVRQHENNQHGFLIKRANCDPDDIVEEVNDSNP